MHALNSEHWHVIRGLCPRLRDGVEVVHRRLRRQPWVLIVDPVSQRFHRVAPLLWQVLVLMDGRRTLDQIWQECLAQAEHNAQQGQSMLPLGQPELVQLLAQLHSLDLIQTQVTPDSAEVLERYSKQRSQRLRQALLNPLGLKIPLLHPDAWFNRLAGAATLIFSPWMLVLWMIVVLPAILLAWQHWAELTQNLADRVLSLKNLAVLWLVYPLVKAVHEVMHGLAVKRWGGSVREMGLMFVVFTPVPYVDASSSYLFPSKWSRATVAAAGIMAELLLGALALHVWLLVETGWVHAVAYNVVLIAGASTLLVNGNPLMRYDGYFALCDLVEIPNLAQRSTQFWAYLVDRYGFGARNAEPPLGAERERCWLVVYGAVAPIYRLIVVIGLAWFIAAKYFFVGVLMALLTVGGATLKPMWQGWKHLRQSPALVHRRSLALRRSGLSVMALLLLAGLVPVPMMVIHQGVVWLPDDAIVRAEEAGHMVLPVARSGSWIPSGAVIGQLSLPQLTADLEVGRASLDLLLAKLRATELEDPVQAVMLRHDIDAEQSEVANLQRRSAALTVRASTQGYWVPAEPTELLGRYVQRGETLGYLVDGPSSLVRVVVTQDDMALIRDRLQGIEVRLERQLGHVVMAELRREVPGGANQMVSAALGTAGGGLVGVDPNDRDGKATLDKVFDLELAMAEPATPAVFGDRVHVRFDLGSLPLIPQLALRLRQLFLARLSV